MRLAHLLALLLPLAGCALQRAPIIDRDAGSLDAPMRDAPRPDAPLPDAPVPDGAVCDPSACDDGEPCTEDRCGVAGCEHVPNTAPCDDGSFCTTGEACSGGACTGGRETCPFCDEASDACGACGTDADCPGAMVGACTFADVCATTGSQDTTTFRCASGTCVADVSSTPCSRSTDGVSCGATTVSRGACMRTGMSCSRGGALAVTTTSFVCGAGACASRSTVATEACDHEPTGDPCRTCTDGACDVPWGSCAGNRTRSCGPGTCAGTGTCVMSGTDTTEMLACSAPAGTGCLSSGSCGVCTRNSGGPGCGMNCTYTAGACAGATCSGAGGPMTSRLPCTCP